MFSFPYLPREKRVFQLFGYNLFTYATNDLCNELDSGIFLQKNARLTELDIKMLVLNI